MVSGFLSSGDLCLIHYLKLFLTSLGLNSLCQKESHIHISEKLDFLWFIPQKITSIGYFGASDDQTIRIRKFFGGNWALEAVEASEVAEAAEVNEAGEVSKAWKFPTEDVSDLRGHLK